MYTALNTALKYTNGVMWFGTQPMFTCTGRWNSVQANGLLTINCDHKRPLLHNMLQVWGKRFHDSAHPYLSLFFFDTMGTYHFKVTHFHFLSHMIHFSPTPNAPEIPQFWMILVTSEETGETKQMPPLGAAPSKTLHEHILCVKREGEKKMTFLFPTRADAILEVMSWIRNKEWEWRTSTSRGRRGQTTFTAGEEMLSTLLICTVWIQSVS